MFFKAVFRPRKAEETIALDNLLRTKLKPPMNYRLGHSSRVTIDVPDCGSLPKTRDECFKTAEWAKHRNGVATDIPYTVVGYEGNPPLLVYDSACARCKAKDPRPHGEHDK